ncbi:CDP-diacylglycerol--serine O-phosphatidyltransferase [Commensalibacter sp. TBRC 10068]|uniref:CDP-diacylglycerol--serine O-phosphatidyltransferase n=1 Tax=Commensalibacter nepenthis TaxID=3043872 RepID=A0ABT6Q627_9PROT|nr:CDP-diacylglycerol--serine O-phosphatidyltransferase [Commensalibacter sp. TBRC 10068]MDI2112354.1 CDP-diacylglycerol--serine O-phosphatidyltransferase [Commensalibacter sp. TBRC 10068]
MLRQKIRPRVKGISFNRIIPNLLTMLGLCAGLIGIRSAIHGDFDKAVIAIVIAACFDGLDGRIARLLRGTSRFGAELDSLADFLSFGISPCFILYMWALQDIKSGYAFVPCAMFAACMALRLARFNASLEDKDNPKYASNFFTGVPAPAGAGIVLFPVFLGLEANKLQWDFLIHIAHSEILTIIMLVTTSFLLISTIPIWSFKNFKVPTAYVLPLFLGTSIYATVLVADPWGTFAFSGLLYLCTIPLSYRSFRLLRADAEALHKEASEEDEEDSTQTADEAPTPPITPP